MASASAPTASFKLPSNAIGYIRASSFQTLLVVSHESSIVASVEGAEKWENITLSYFVLAAEPALGESTLPANNGRSYGEMKSARLAGMASLFIYADRIDFRQILTTVEVLPSLGLSYGSLLNDKQTFREHNQAAGPLLRAADLRLIRFHATGVHYVEWFNATVTCDQSPCPPGGGMHRTGVSGPANAEAHEVDYSFIGATFDNGTLDGYGTSAAMVASGPDPTLQVNGTLRLPGATLDAASCHSCQLDGERTLTVAGNLTLSDLRYTGDDTMSASLGGTAFAARVDEQAVAPQTLGFATGASSSVAAVALAAGAFVLWKLLGAALFTRLRKDPLDHPRRKAIHAYVLEHPGATFREVARGSQLAAGTARHHLTVLVRGGLLVEHPYRSSVRFFENHGKFASNWRETVLRREPPLALLESWIQANPGRPQRDVLDAMAEGQGWSRSTTQHRLGRLVAQGLVHIVPVGRLLLYKPGPKAAATPGQAASGWPSLGGAHAGLGLAPLASRSGDRP